MNFKYETFNSMTKLTKSGQWCNREISVAQFNPKSSNLRICNLSHVPRRSLKAHGKASDDAAEAIVFEILLNDAQPIFILKQKLILPTCAPTGQDVRATLSFAPTVRPSVTLPQQRGRLTHQNYLQRENGTG